MPNVDWPTLLIGAIPGVLALGAALVGYGHAMQRLTTVERDVAAVKGDVAKLSDLSAKVATIEERTKNTADNMQAMREDVSKITGHLLDEGRSFSHAAPRRTRG